jgi:hypothetical protein
LGLINGSFDGPFLILFRIIPQLSSDRYWSSHAGVSEIAMASFAASIYEAGRLQFGDEFTNLSRYRVRAMKRSLGI